MKFGAVRLLPLLILVVGLGRVLRTTWLGTWKTNWQSSIVCRRVEETSKRLARVSLPRRETKQSEEEGSIAGAVGGAVLGGLLLGPFGAVFGANLGSEWGRRGKNYVEEDIDEDIVKLAKSVGRELADAMDNKVRLEEIKDSLAAKAVRLQDDVDDLTKKATSAVEADDEAAARTFLERKYPLQQSLESTKTELETALRRVSTAKLNVQKLEKQALEVSSLLERAQQASGVERTALKAEASAFSVKDPLLDKFDRL